MEFICGFILGIFSTQFLHYLPSLSHFVIGIASAIIISSILHKHQRHRFNYFFVSFCLGSIWMIIYAFYALSWRLDSGVEGKNCVVEGYIASIPIKQSNYLIFNFQLSSLQGKKSQALIRLSWNNDYPIVSVGDKWRFIVRLKQPHGFLNPGGFDKEKQFLINHIRAEGYITKNQANVCLQSRIISYPLQRLRQYLQHKISALLSDSPFLGIIMALTIGMTNDISQDQWQIFRNTGTNHLVAISGLHIGLVASIFALLIKQIWRRSTVALHWLPAPKIGVFSGLLVAIIYSALAGFSVSTQRSMLMLVLWGAAQLLRRQVTFTWVFFLSMALVLVFNPFAIFSMSFWLSYTAVGCLLYGMSARLRPSGYWWKWGRPQWVVFVGMLPLSLLFFQQITFVSMLANVVAIPWVSFLIVPELLLGLVVSLFQHRLAYFIVCGCEKLLAILWYFLQSLGHHQELIWQYDIQNTVIFLLATIGITIVILPKGMPARWISLTWFVPVFFYNSHTSLSNQLRFTVLDVGQGLATVISTRNHTLIYDAGLRLNDSYDMGKVVVMPYLLHEHRKVIDMLVISHGDNDHIGGAFSLIRQLPVQRIVTSVPDRFKNKPVIRCQAGMHWQWEGADFKFLHPYWDNTDKKANNISCVLKVSYGRHTILLTGDIEKSVESALVNNIGSELASSILLVPHHGSKTSSSKPFLERTKAKYAVFSFGYLNRYHHPNKQVWNRYLKMGSLNLDTVTSGAITMTLNRLSDIVLVDRYRITHHRFWHR